MLNTKDNEFNSVAISLLWHEPPMLCRSYINGPAYVDGRKRENSSVWKYHIMVTPTVDVPCSLVVKKLDFGWQIVAQ